VLVKIKTDAGIIGIGEAYHGAGVHQIVVDERLRGPMIGQNPCNVDKLFHDMMYSMSASGYYQGAVMSAISGIEMALWDIVGQAAGMPIWQLLGGKFRDRIRVYRTYSQRKDSPAAYAAQAREIEAQGFTAMKFCIDPLANRQRSYNRTISREDLLYHVSAVAAIRENLQPSTDLMVEAHWQYAPVDILRFAQAMESFNLLWLEDPIPPQNVAAMAKVSASTRTPIGTGENFYTRFGFRDLLQAQAASIITPDISKAGGLLEGRRIADLADMYYVNVAPHSVGSPIYTIAASHVCAAIPNFLVLETQHLSPECWKTMIKESPLIQEGHIVVPDRPGLGVTLNEEVARQHTREDLGFFD
jgi:L-alanine-DL-glutamate epimerase-like enolase superfamily enzyme